jgi:hypothetical protein
MHQRQPHERDAEAADTDGIRAIREDDAPCAFLVDMQVIVPWAELVAVVEPFYPKIGEAGGRPPLPLERMLGVYFLQLWFNLSDPAVEEELYDSASMRNSPALTWEWRRRPTRRRCASFLSAGEEQTGKETADDRQRSSAQRHQDHDRDDCRCDDYRSAEFD